MAVDLTALLPVEVLLAVFDHLCFTELARLLSVSKRWATVVRSHRTYWSYPQLAHTSPAAVALFGSRLEASSGKPIAISINIQQPFALLDTTLLPSVATHLDHVVSLTLHIHIIHAPAVFDALRSPAPSLRYLQIFFEADDEQDPTAPRAVTLPQDVLTRGAHPRGLETVLFQNIDVLPPLPPALAMAANLVYSQKGAQPSTSLLTLADAFPAVRDVSLHRRALPRDVGFSDWPEPWASLDSLTISTSKHSLRNAIRALPLASIDHLTIVGASRREFSALLWHLRGPLHLAFKDLIRGTFLLHLASWTDGVKRSFRERKVSWLVPESVPHPFLQSPMLLEQLVSLTIPSSLWSLLVPHLPPLDRLLQLNLIICSEFTLERLLSVETKAERVIACPDLQTLTIATVGRSVVVSQDEIARVILELLRAPAPIQLGLQNVYVDAWTERPGLIDAVLQREVGELYPKSPWHM
ncbi:hypothetical protein AURDEDRAFT_182941 [Auricularia subglabra TFB-10046 SS5]|nr:hypothetical protein AURDEDRAFT_182941 [Auricularia subglabra TFB-10046 SS5]